MSPKYSNAVSKCKQYTMNLIQNFNYIFGNQISHQRDHITKEEAIQALLAAHSVEHGVSVIDITSLLSHLSLPLVLLVAHPVQNIASNTHGM
jgi:hypothetical protein